MTPGARVRARVRRVRRAATMDGLPTLLGSAAAWGAAHAAVSAAVRRAPIAWPPPSRAAGGHVSARRLAVKVVSSLHALFSFSSGLCVVWEVTGGTFTALRRDGAASRSLGDFIRVEGGFYLFDFLSDVYRVCVLGGGPRLVDVSFFAHHLVPIAVFPAYMSWRARKLKLAAAPAGDPAPAAGEAAADQNVAFLDFVTACLLVTNISTVLTNVRWMLNAVFWRSRRTTTGSKVTLRALDGAVVVVYFLCRVALWPMLLAMYRAQQGQAGWSLLDTLRGLPLRCSVGTVTLGCTNVYFWLLNLRKLMASARKKQA